MCRADLSNLKLSTIGVCICLVTEENREKNATYSQSRSWVPNYGSKRRNTSMQSTIYDV